MKNYLRILLLLIFLSPLSASANIFSYISKVETINPGTSMEGRIYIGTVERWTPMPGVSNPCYNRKGCEVYLSHRHYDNGTAGISSSSYPRLTNASDYRTMDELREAFRKVMPLPYNFRVAHGGRLPTIAECVGLFYGEGKSEKDPLLPGSICGTAPTPNLSCNFDLESIDFKYNDLNYNDVLSNEASVLKQTKTITIGCNYSAKVVVSAVSNNDGSILLNADGSLVSFLKINNKPANGTIEMLIEKKESSKRYTNTFTLSSELRSQGKFKAGSFSGSTVVIIAVL